MKKFIWIIYPVVVMFLVIYSVSLWQGGNIGQLDQLFAKKVQVSDEEQKLSILQNKATSLSEVDRDVENDNLSWAIKVHPAVKQVEAILDEINMTATFSGTTIGKYTGRVGEVKEASGGADLSSPIGLKIEYNADNFGQMQKIVESFEKSIPLIKIDGMVFDSETATVTISGAWAPWVSVSAEALTPLPEYKQILWEMKAKLKDFLVLPEESDVATESAEVNPF